MLNQCQIDGNEDFYIRDAAHCWFCEIFHVATARLERLISYWTMWTCDQGHSAELQLLSVSYAYYRPLTLLSLTTALRGDYGHCSRHMVNVSPLHYTFVVYVCLRDATKVSWSWFSTWLRRTAWLNGWGSSAWWAAPRLTAWPRG